MQNDAHAISDLGVWRRHYAPESSGQTISPSKRADEVRRLPLAPDSSGKQVVISRWLRLWIRGCPSATAATARMPSHLIS